VQVGFVAVSVADTGCGIAPENLQHIFEPFFTTKHAGQGTGLGLSQVFGFAKQSGGDIHVHSQLEVGTTFTLYLPRAAQPALAGPRKIADAELPRGEGSCILVVEDNPEVSSSVEQTLQELGYLPVMTSSAEHALQAFEREPARFAAVFSDVVMSGMDGIELGTELRRRAPTLPVVLSSGYSYVLSQRPDHGFTLLPKPYSLQDLARVIKEAIDGRRRSAPQRTLQNHTMEAPHMSIPPDHQRPSPDLEHQPAGSDRRADLAGSDDGELFADGEVGGEGGLAAPLPERIEQALADGQEPSRELLDEVRELADAPSVSDEELARQALAAPGADGDPRTPE
jgi:CheY-like chemotaxis protein